jgi:hypothetical protein
MCQVSSGFFFLQANSINTLLTLPGATGRIILFGRVSALCQERTFNFFTLSFYLDAETSINVLTHFL